MRPRAAKQVLLVEAEPNDDELLREHLRRGWPGRFAVKGIEHDYVVLDSTGNPVETVERAIRAAQIVKERAHAGSVQGQSAMDSLDPRALDN